MLGVPLPSLSCWWKDLTGDGDIESNPGPPHATFEEFSAKFAGDFLSIAEKNTLAKGVVNLRSRSRSWPGNWLATLFGLTQQPMEDNDSIQIVAGFEMYSGSSLSWSPMDRYGPQNLMRLPF